MRRATGPQVADSPDASVTVAMIRGLAISTHVHRQVLAATQWVVVHDLGYDPGGIAVVDAEGDLLEGWGVAYTIPGDALVLAFDIPISGSAYLS